MFGRSKLAGLAGILLTTLSCSNKINPPTDSPQQTNPPQQYEKALGISQSQLNDIVGVEISYLIKTRNSLANARAKKQKGLGYQSEKVTINQELGRLGLFPDRLELIRKQNPGIKGDYADPQDWKRWNKELKDAYNWIYPQE